MAVIDTNTIYDRKYCNSKVTVMTSTIMKDILSQAKNIASSAKNVLIMGEYGSGKGWLAKRIHQLGNRCGKPFIKINCHLIEEHEIFPKIFGRLTHTMYGVRIDQGLFEQSQGGTILFEGFDSLPEQVQQQIVAAYTSSRIQRVGSKQTTEIESPRVIGTVEVTSYHTVTDCRFLTEAILSCDPYIIALPPLRHRREDIVPLIQAFFSQEFKDRYNITATGVSPATLYRCVRYDWPGNVKQLKNVVGQTAITSEQEIIHPEDLPASVRNRTMNGKVQKRAEDSRSYREAEKQLIRSVLARTGFYGDAADMLGISRKRLFSKIEKFELLPHHRGGQR